MHTRYAAIIVIILSACIASCGVEKNLKRGDKHLALGEYYDAAGQFKQAYSKLPAKERERRGAVSLKLARCYEKLNATSKAIAAYRNAIRYHYASAEDMLQYGRQLLKNGSYKAAQEVFKTILDSLPNNILVRNGLISAEKAPLWKKIGSHYTVKLMDVFNSRRDDYSPVLCGDQFDRLYFTSTRNEANGDELSGITGTKAADIFVSEKDDKGKWSKPEPVTGGLNTAYDEGACALSPDQKNMYLTQCTTDATYPRYAQIVTSERADAAWPKSSTLEITKDTLSSYAHPAISPDGEWLYFSSDMPGGLGGLDIWRIRITNHGLGGVENLGEPINTPGDEEFPTFRPNGDFYFSSNGHPGMGGLDIYIATVGSNGKYRLFHPGYPLNSQGDDFGMTFDGPHNRGFFSSNRNDGRGWDHIYSFENPEIVLSIKGWIYEMDGYELPAAQVQIVGDDGTNEVLSVKGDGSFTYTAKPNVNYLLLASCKGFLNHKEEIHIDKTDESKEYVLQFPLASITAPVLIDNIFYDLNKATLRPESSQALDKLVQLLNDNPHVAIELGAHCDYRGTTEYNLQLSQRRAESVIKYLIEKGIENQRLVAKGYGKSVPKSVNRKLSEKYEWLQTGETLTESFIAKQLKDNQEICNQLNRRTEFRVIKTTYGLLDKDGKLLNKPQRPSKKQNENPDDELFLIQ